MQISSHGPKKWTVVGHIDAASNLEPDSMRHAACWQTVEPQDVNVVMQVRRKAYKPKPAPTPRSYQRKAIVAGVTAAVGFGMAGALASSSPVAAITLGALGAVSAYVAGQAIKKSVPPPQLKEAPPRHHEPAWEGTRTLELTASASGTRKQLDSPIVAETQQVKAPDPQELGRSLGRLLDSYPSEHRAIVFGGHGSAYQGWSAYSMDEMARALEAAAGEKKIDLVIFDACLMGNLEALRKLAPHARYAIASEEIMYTGNRAWGLAFNDLKGAQQGPEELGKTIVKALGGHWESRTFSLIDLARLEPLAQKVEQLGDALNYGGEREAAAQALDVRTFGNHAEHGYGDLGDVLEKLGQNIKGPAAQQAIEETRRALDEAVLANSTQMCYDHCHGLSVRVPTHRFDSGKYTRQTDMPRWASLLEHLRPAPRDRTIINHRSII